ncbi:MAG: ribose-phosphate pyrophosphokinase [Blastocatellia bacterium]|nr:ribose-phosphate pyrophosphokinase [Blastocatellia bacterium]
MLVFSGNSNKPLAEEICRHLKIHLGEANTTRFSDGEFNFQILQNVRGADVFIVQPTSPPVDSHVMELLIMLDAFRRSSADRITAVIPYYGYGRKDRKDKPRVPISAKLVANLITAAGANRILTMDLHAGQIQGFFDIPVDHLFAAPVLIDYFTQKPIPKLVVVSPDTGGAERARAYAKRLNAELALADKRRAKDRANVVEVMNIVGEVKGRNVLIIDDMVDTAGSLTQVAFALKEAGAEDVYACCSHAILSGLAIERIEKSPIKELVVTNSVPMEKAADCSKITCLSIAKLLAEAIKSIHDETSVSKLFI